MNSPIILSDTSCFCMFHYFTIDKIDAVSSINIHLLGRHTDTTPVITLDDNDMTLGPPAGDVEKIAVFFVLDSHVDSK